MIEALSEYSSEEDALALIKNIDIAKDSYESFVFYDNDEDYDNFLTANENAWAIISMMYYNKYGIDLSEDNLMMAYMTATNLEDYIGIGVDDGFLVDVIVNKHYFVKPDTDYVIVDYNVKDEMGIQGKSLTIDESNRYINNQSKKNKL